MGRVAAIITGLLLTATARAQVQELAHLREVNPVTAVPAELQPQVFRFTQALVVHGFKVASATADDHLDLKLELDSGAISFDITATLSDHGTTLVRTPVNVKSVRNLPFLKKSALADAAELAALRFSKDLAAYVRTLETDPQRTAAAAPAPAPAN